MPSWFPATSPRSTSGDPGEQTSVGWTLTNSGTAAATGPWTEQVFLATDAAGDNPTLLSAQSFTGTLGVESVGLPVDDRADSQPACGKLLVRCR